MVTVGVGVYRISVPSSKPATIHLRPIQTDRETEDDNFKGLTLG